MERRNVSTTKIEKKSRSYGSHTSDECALPPSGSYHIFCYDVLAKVQALKNMLKTLTQSDGAAVGITMKRYETENV